MNNFYEKQTYKDEKLPMIYHYDTAYKKSNWDFPHWHENIELLFFTNGNAIVNINDAHLETKKGDIVIINSNNLHNVMSISEETNYHCLIIDKHFCEEFDFFTGEVFLDCIVSDKVAQKIFNRIVKEFVKKNEYHQTSIKAESITLLTHLYRNYKLTGELSYLVPKNSKVNMVKNVIKFIQANYKNAISISDMAKEVCYSKYYLLHNFKEITGYTIISYVNFSRCVNAKKLLSQNKSIEEVAFLCGFENSSYFTRTYKKHMGILPSSEKKQSIMMKPL